MKALHVLPLFQRQVGLYMQAQRCHMRADKVLSQYRLLSLTLYDNYRSSWRLFDMIDCNLDPACTCNEHWRLHSCSPSNVANYTLVLHLHLSLHTLHDELLILLEMYVRN